MAGAWLAPDSQREFTTGGHGDSGHDQNERDDKPDTREHDPHNPPSDVTTADRIGADAADDLLDAADEENPDVQPDSQYDASEGDQDSKDFLHFIPPRYGVVLREHRLAGSQIFVL